MRIRDIFIAIGCGFCWFRMVLIAATCILELLVVVGEEVEVGCRRVYFKRSEINRAVCEFTANLHVFVRFEWVITKWSFFGEETQRDEAFYQLFSYQDYFDLTFNRPTVVCHENTINFTLFSAWKWLITVENLEIPSSEPIDREYTIRKFIYDHVATYFECCTLVGHAFEHVLDWMRNKILPSLYFPLNSKPLRVHTTNPSQENRTPQCAHVNFCPTVSLLLKISIF